MIELTAFARRSCRFSLSLGLALLVTTALWAYPTTWNPVDVKCPLCGKDATGAVIMSTNTFGGQDSDLLRHASGTQPVTLHPVTCSHCYFSGYLKEFQEPQELTEEQRERLRTELKPFSAIEAGTPSFKMPAAVRYDLIAQTYTILGREPEQIADQYLHASWGERVDCAVRDSLGAETRERFGAGLRALELPDEVVAEPGSPYVNKSIPLGMRWHRHAAELKDEPRWIALVYAICILRPHGWNAEILEIVKELKDALPAEDYEGFHEELTASLERERGFQVKAAEMYERILEKEEGRGDLLYLASELHRRARNHEKARALFARAVQAKEPEWVAKVAAGQAKLVPSKR